MEGAFFVILSILWAACAFGPGLLLVRPLRLKPAERLVAGVGASLLLIYLASFVISRFRLGVDAHFIFSGACLVATFVAVPDLRQLWRRRSTRRAIQMYALLVLFGLGMLGLVRHYSGGTWGGDWYEHWQRTAFWMEPDKSAMDMKFIDQWTLPARPPLLNLVSSHFVIQSGKTFASFQATMLLLNSVTFLSMWLLARTLVPRGRRVAEVLAVLLACCPMFMQNVTYSWTKMGTAFFVIAAVAMYVRSLRRDDLSLRLAAFSLMASGCLAHYSAGPYAVFLGGHWVVRLLTRRREKAGAAKEFAIVSAAGVMILTTWFAWSFVHYGWKGTTAVNPTIEYGARGVLGGDVSQVLYNAANTFVPEILRKPSMIYSEDLDQPNAVGRVRDFMFLIYQVSLPFAPGLLGGPIAIGLVLRNLLRAEAAARKFWIGFIVVVVPLAIVVNSGPDRFGIAHVTLQPAAMMLVALLAGCALRLPRGWRAVLFFGCAVDFVLGVLIQFHVENRVFQFAFESGSHTAVSTADMVSRAGQLNAYWKKLYTLTFFGDPLKDSAGAIQVLAALSVGAALVWLAWRGASPRRPGIPPVRAARKS